MLTSGGLRAVMAPLIAAVVMLLVAGCGADGDGDSLAAILEADKTRVTVDATFDQTELVAEGRQTVWIRQSSGWDPCPDRLVADVPPEACWVRVFVDDTQVSILFPEPDGSLGPFPITIHFGVFQFAPGDHALRLVQSTRLDVRETAPTTLKVRLPSG
jgi:hypothetical protein